MIGGKPGSSGETVKNLFSPNKSKYCTRYIKGDKHLISFKFPEPLNISAYAFRMANDCPDRDPRKWTVSANIIKKTDPIEKFLGTFRKDGNLDHTWEVSFNGQNFIVKEPNHNEQWTANLQDDNSLQF